MTNGSIGQYVGELKRLYFTALLLRSTLHTEYGIEISSAYTRPTALNGGHRDDVCYLLI